MKAVDLAPAADRAAHWAKTLQGVKDPMLQVAWIREQLQELGASRAADVLTVVLARAEQREERYATLLLWVSLALAAPEAQAQKRAIANLADMHGQVALARFLGGAEIPPDDEEEEDAEGALPDDPEGPAPRGRRAKAPDFGRGRPLTLGERKSLARKRDRNLLARVLRDPHPDVIRVLLANPALVEDDIVRLCALRPVSPEVILEVFRNPRWIVRYRVKHAIARNPHTPEDLAVQLVPHLSPADRKELSFVAHASERLRASCLSDENEKPLH